jgi:hypothetical protein
VRASTVCQRHASLSRLSVQPGLSLYFSRKLLMYPALIFNDHLLRKRMVSGKLQDSEHSAGYCHGTQRSFAAMLPKIDCRVCKRNQSHAPRHLANLSVARHHLTAGGDGSSHLSQQHPSGDPHPSLSENVTWTKTLLHWW